MQLQNPFQLREDMPRFKVLKGVAHNIGHSFVSLMNYSENDYCMGHILKFARETGDDTLILDLLAGQGNPKSLLRKPISELPDRYAKMFLNMVHRSGSDPALVRSATLTLSYDLQQKRPSPIGGQSPYTCEVAITDVRGKKYAAWFSGWWQIESPGRQWWNPFKRLRSQ